MMHMTEPYLEWLGKQTRDRYLRSVQNEEDMGRHSPPEETHIFSYRGYACEACNGSWASLEPDGGDEPEELPCLATEGCEGLVVALYPTIEPPPSWIPVIIQGGKS